MDLTRGLFNVRAPRIPLVENVAAIVEVKRLGVGASRRHPIRMPNLTKSDTNDGQPERTYIHRKARFIHNSFASIPGS
jgi:hypothetical protein